MPTGSGQSRRVVTLSTRQREIVALAAEGLRDKEIARRLELSEGTIRTHLRRAYIRNGANGKTDLVVAWIRSELTIA